MLLAVCRGEKMIDGHIHIECGAYTIDWINRFVNKAVEMGINKMRLLDQFFGS